MCQTFLIAMKSLHRYIPDATRYDLERAGHWSAPYQGSDMRPALPLASLIIRWGWHIGEMACCIQQALISGKRQQNSKMRANKRHTRPAW
jgi:hypothetical protein